MGICGWSRGAFLALACAVLAGCGSATSAGTGGPPQRAAGLPSGVTALPHTLAFERVGSGFVAREGKGALRLRRGGVDLGVDGKRQAGVELVGAREKLTPRGVDKLDGVVNRYGGDDRKTWIQGSPTFGRVHYDEAWPGIDVAFHGTNDELEYDFVVAPGADPRDIVMRHTGAAAPKLTRKGDLQIDTEAGPITQKRPVLYQDIDGRRVRVSGRYVVDGRTVRIAVGRYNHSHTLVVDPVLTYVRTFGGSSDDRADAVVVGADGAAYVVGTTKSGDFPLESPFDASANGNDDIFVTKRSASTGGLLWATYLGGSTNDTGTSIALHTQDTPLVLVGGNSFSTNFPRVPDSNPGNAGNRDGIFATFNASSGAMVQSRYVGGTLDDSVNGVAQLSSGKVVVGGTTSGTIPGGTAGFQSTPGGGQDAFLRTYSSPGASTVVERSTYYGGPADEDLGALAVDTQDRVHISGDVSGAGLPVAGHLQDASGGGWDVFYARIPGALLSPLGVSSYFGGSGNDFSAGVGVDGRDTPVLAGVNGSPNLPGLTAEEQAAPSFVMALQADGLSRRFVRPIFGSDPDRTSAVAAIAVETDGRIGLTGYQRDPGIGLLDSRLDVEFWRLSRQGEIEVNQAIPGAGRGELGLAAAWGDTASATHDLYIAGSTTLAGDFGVGTAPDPGPPGFPCPECPPPPDTDAFVVRVDGTAPDITISDSPAARTRGATQRFEFSSTDPEATFRCSYDGAAPVTCASPLIKGFAVGDHSVEIWAVDPALNPSTHHSFDFEVVSLNIRPVVAITSGPSGVVDQKSFRFTFDTTPHEKYATFECQFDGVPETPHACPSPMTYLRAVQTTQGEHTFKVWAVDYDGHRSAFPATRTFTNARQAIAITLPDPDRTVLTGRDYQFSAVPADNPPGTLIEWDFGLDQQWTNEDLDDPLSDPAKPFTPELTGPTVTRQFPLSLSGFDDPTLIAGQNVMRRRTTLLRVRVTRGDSVVIRAIPLVIQPDKAPVADLHQEPDLVEYLQTAHIQSDSSDPNEHPNPARDGLVSEHFAVGVANFPAVHHAPPVRCNVAGFKADGCRNGFDINLYQTALNGQPDFGDTTKVPIGGKPLPTYPKYKNNKSDAATKKIVKATFELAFKQSVQAQKEIQDRAVKTDGTTHAKDFNVSSQVVDRSGVAGSITKLIRVRPWDQPTVEASIGTAESPIKGDNIITDPIVADPVEGNGNGTQIVVVPEIGLDPQGKAKYYVLEVGTPWQSKGNCDEQAQGKDDGKSKGGLVNLPAKAPKKTPGSPVARAALASKKQKQVTSSKKVQVSRQRKAFCKHDDYGVNSIKTLVTKDPKALKMSIPKPTTSKTGPYSIMLSVYDQTGARGRVRYDGLQVEGASQKCANLSRTIKTADGRQINVTGVCMSSSPDGTTVVSPQAIDVNGIQITPPEGQWAVVDQDGKRIFATQKATPGSIPNKGSSLKDDGKLVISDAGLDLAVLTDSGKNAFDHLTDEKGYSYSIVQGANIKGFPITGELLLTMNNGASKLNYEAQMPAVFAVNGPAPTMKAQATGTNAGSANVLKKCSGSCKGSASRAALRGGPVAHAAVKAPTLEVGEDISLGGIPIDVGVNSPLKFTFDPNTGNLKGSIKIPLMGGETTLEILLRNGEFIYAEGKLEFPEDPASGIPIAPGVIADAFQFKITAKPKVKLEASVHVKITGGIITAEGHFVLEPKPFHIGVGATAYLLDLIKLAQAQFDIYSNKFTFEASAGVDFGPASIKATVEGAFTPKHFYVQGTGEACLSIACATIKGLVSDKALAACGSVNLGFANPSIGAAYTFSSKDLDVFTSGCDLSPYKPNITRSLNRRDLTRTVVPGGQEPRVSIDPKFRGVAFIATAVPDGGGATPRFEVQAPDGTVYRTTEKLGDLTSTPTGALIDQDTSFEQSRIVIPQSGLTIPEGATGAATEFVVRALDGGPVISDVSVSRIDAPLTNDLLKGDTFALSSTDGASIIKTNSEPIYGTASLAEVNSGYMTRKGRAQAGYGSMPGVEVEDQRFPLELTAKIDPSKLRRFTFANTEPFPTGTKVTFVERGGAVEQALGTATADAQGVLRMPNGTQTFVFAPGRDDAVQAADAGAYAGIERFMDADVVNPQEIYRGRVESLVKYERPIDFYGPPPDITGLVDDSGTGPFVVLGGDPGPGINIEFTAVSPTGHVTAMTISHKDVQTMPAATVKKLAELAPIKAARARSASGLRQAGATAPVYGVRLPSFPDKRKGTVTFRPTGVGVNPAAATKLTTLKYDPKDSITKAMKAAAKKKADAKKRKAAAKKKAAARKKAAAKKRK